MRYHFALPSLFDEICSTFPDKVAVRYTDESFTYRTLYQDVASLTSFLLQTGVKKGDVVVIFNSKRYISFVLMLACIKSGVIYANVDPDIPVQWFSHVINLCNPTIVFTDDEANENILLNASVCQVNVFSIDGLLRKLKNESSPLTKCNLTGNTIAYIMFTSGSTGKPKGVAVTHQNLIHFINWGISRYEITPEDILANVNPMHFDNSVFDFYIALFSGASIAPIQKSIVSSPQRLVDTVEKIGCTIWFSVPSLLIYLVNMKVLNSNSFLKLRILSFGGEGYHKQELKKLYNFIGHRIKLINVYGPTECTCICSSYDIDAKDFDCLDELPSLGAINNNISYLILNEQNKISSLGELCLLGPNVAAGYYNDFEKTASCFFSHTNHGYFQDKMYRTGDIVEEKNGLLYFIGRKDNQVKHMGYRMFYLVILSSNKIK